MSFPPQDVIKHNT